MRKAKELQGPILLNKLLEEPACSITGLRKKNWYISSRDQKETQIRNNHFYPEVRKHRLYELILLSSIILTQILISGATVLGKCCVRKCLSIYYFSKCILKEITDFLCIILGEMKLPKAFQVPTTNTPYAYAGMCSNCHSVVHSAHMRKII